jgi:hypothetical protein
LVIVAVGQRTLVRILLISGLEIRLVGGQAAMMPLLLPLVRRISLHDHRQVN